MEKITIIGSGNVAFHLCKLFSGLNFELDLFSRNSSKAKQFEKLFKLNHISSIEKIKNEFVLVCVSDNSVNEIISKLNDNNKIAYTSGVTELNSLPKKANLGVFYPLQTFSEQRDLNLNKVPFLIEANNEAFGKELFELASKISQKVEFADSEKRKNIHLAAVFANNFTNHLLYLSKKILAKKNIDWNLLLPLIQETFSKAIEIGPENGQTGPAKRKDLLTIEKHLKELDSPMKEIYQEITNSILQTYGHEKL